MGLGFNETIEWAGKGIEAAGVAVIVIGILRATLRFAPQLFRDAEHTHFRDYRRSIGRSILLGLEFLIAGDIIRTVAIDPTFQSVGVLAIVVAIRTFLSLELELEIDGKWPWQREQKSESV